MKNAKTFMRLACGLVAAVMTLSVLGTVIIQLAYGL